MGERHAVVGGGILGAAVARELLRRDPDARVTLLEKEAAPATHQTGRNSGVVHAGLYYEPGSAKAVLCRRGVGLLEDFCAEHGIARVTCGKVLVALDAAELARLDGIAARAGANGVPGVRIVDAHGLADLEPHVRGVGALHSPSTSIVDYAEVTRALLDEAVAAGADVLLGHEVVGVEHRGPEIVLASRSDGGRLRLPFDRVVVCAGLQGDRIGRMAGDARGPEIMPFRGEYHRLRPERRDLVRGLVYPVPDPRYPFLGVHVTPRVDGEVTVGPNAVLALAREGYGWGVVSPRDLAQVARSPASWRFAARHWRTGVHEVAGSLSRHRYADAVRAYLPDVEDDDLLPAPAGVRAQALDADGSLVDDFRISRPSERVVVLRNAPSPAATSALAIAEEVVAQATDRDVSPGR